MPPTVTEHIHRGWFSASGPDGREEEFDQIGFPFAEPAVRVSRAEEAVQVVKGFWGDDPFSFFDDHYTITDLNGLPESVQRPHFPIFFGSGGRRLLSSAAREADKLISRFVPVALVESTSARRPRKAFPRRVARVKDAAGERFPAGGIEPATL